MRNVPNDPNCTPKFAAMSFRGNLARVVLTGFMARANPPLAGRLPKELAGISLMWNDHIETSTGVTAKVLFDTLGERGFRQLESDVLASSLRGSQTVIALGGAAIDMTANQTLLANRPHTLVVFLDAPFVTLMERCKEQERTGSATYRPLLHKPDIALARFSVRKSLYRGSRSYDCGCLGRISGRSRTGDIYRDGCACVASKSYQSPGNGHQTTDLSDDGANKRTTQE